jgi:hypothetical protein
VYGCGPHSTTMHLTTLQLSLWLSPTIVESVIVMAMFYRKLWRSLPIFLSYLIFTISRTCFLFLERSNIVEYFYAYWVTEAIGSLVVLCVIKELFDNAFHKQLGLRQLGNVLFRWSIAVLVVVAVVIAWKSPGGDTKRLMAGILIVKRTVTFVEAGLLGFLFLFAVTMGLGWQHYATGVSLGFGIYGAVELTAITARAIYGEPATGIFNWVIMTVNNCCVFTWAAYFLMPVHEPKQQLSIDAENRLEEWNNALLQLMKK